jgi:hypothetical protein
MSRPPIYDENWFRELMACFIAGVVSGILLVPIMLFIEFIIKKNIMEYVVFSLMIVASVIAILGIIDIEKQIRKLK